MATLINFKTTTMNICLDARRYENGWMFSPGFWVVLSYRIRRLRKSGGPIGSSMFLFDVLLGLLRRFISNTTIPSNMTVGAGLYLPHPEGIIINSMATIGNNVSIFQQVTIGEWKGKAPVIGDHCAIFAGAKVFGGITIGADCKVGANAVVSSDIPSNSTVSVGAMVVRTQPS